LTAKQRLCNTMCYMLAPEQMRVIVSFLLDGAKILFGSLVVGVFVPSAAGAIPWATFVTGLGLTAAFLAIAVVLSKTPISRI